MAAKTCRMQVGVTQTLEIDVFKDEISDSFLNAASVATVSIWDVNVTPAVELTSSPLTLVYVASSDGKYQVLLAHDLDGAFLVNKKFRFDVVIQEGSVRYEDTMTVIFVDSLD